MGESKKISFDWYEIEPGQLHGPWEPDECQCRLRDNPVCTLAIEEGQATLRHDVCGLPLWLYPEDIWFETKVAVDITTCSDPGGWHGMERCDCGPTVEIELHDA